MNRTERTTIRWTPDELVEVKQKAEAANMPVADYIRHAALERKIRQPKTGGTANAEAWLQASRLLNNLNQIAKRLNEAKREGTLVETAEAEVNELRGAIMEIREKLL